MAAGRGGGSLLARLLRWFLGLLWLVHGLEKVGVHWPGVLAGGTHSVLGMLQLLAAETPFALVRRLAADVFLPLGPVVHWGVAATELFTAASFLTGILVPWAALLGLGIQGLLALGFVNSDWSFLYPQIILAQLVAAAPLLRREGWSRQRLFPWVRAARRRLGGLGWGTAQPEGERDFWLFALRISTGAVWIGEAVRLAAGGSYHALGALAVGVLLVIGLATPLAAAAGFLLTWIAWPSDWGWWPWAYYTAAAVHAVLALGGAGRIFGLDAARGRRARRYRPGPVL